MTDYIDPTNIYSPHKSYNQMTDDVEKLAIQLEREFSKQKEYEDIWCTNWVELAKHVQRLIIEAEIRGLEYRYDENHMGGCTKRINDLKDQLRGME